MNYEIQPDDKIYVGLTGMIALSKAVHSTMAQLGQHDKADEAQKMVRFIDNKLHFLELTEVQKGVMASLAMMAGAGNDAYNMFTEMLSREGSIDGPTRFFAEEIMSRAAVNKLPQDSYVNGIMKAYRTGQPLHAFDVAKAWPVEGCLEAQMKGCYISPAPRSVQ